MRSLNLDKQKSSKPFRVIIDVEMLETDPIGVYIDVERHSPDASASDDVYMGKFEFEFKFEFEEIGRN